MRCCLSKKLNEIFFHAKSRDCVCLLVAPLSVTVDVKYPPFLINYRLW